MGRGKEDADSVLARMERKHHSEEHDENKVIYRVLRAEVSEVKKPKWNMFKSQYSTTLEKGNILKIF